MATSNTGHMVDDFENAFQACLSTLTNQDYFNIHDSEEVKSSAEQTLQRFLDMAKHMECFFLQKRLLLSAQKPEQIIREDINELKLELSRKEQLVQKLYEKIQYWQNLLSDLQGPGRPQQQQPVQPTLSQTPTIPVNGGIAPSSVTQQVPNSSIPSNIQPPPPQLYGPSTVPSQIPAPHPGSQTAPSSMISGLQGPLAYLEKTTSNIGIGEMRR